MKVLTKTGRAGKNPGIRVIAKGCEELIFWVAHGADAKETEIWVGGKLLGKSVLGYIRTHPQTPKAPKNPTMVVQATPLGQPPSLELLRYWRISRVAVRKKGLGGGRK